MATTHSIGRTIRRQDGTHLGAAFECLLEAATWREDAERGGCDIHGDGTIVLTAQQCRMAMFHALRRAALHRGRHLQGKA